MAGYPIRIAFNAGNGIQEFAGVENLPYLYHIHYGIVQVTKAATAPPVTTDGNGDFLAISSTAATSGTLTDPGAGVLLQIPTIWNPHDKLSSRGATVSGVNLYPTQFQLVADSTSPDAIGTANYDKYYAYGVGGNTILTGTTLSTINATVRQSYNADPTSPNFTGAFAAQPSYTSANKGGRASAFALSAANTAMTFTVNSSTDPNGTLFREPTLLFKTGYANLASQNSLLTAGLTAFNTTATSPSSPLNTISPEPAPPAIPFTGIYMGVIPLRWIAMVSGTIPYTITAMAAQSARYNQNPASTPGNDDVKQCFLTYRMQYKDASGNWQTYDTKYVNTYQTGNALGTMSFQYNGSLGILIGYTENGSVQGGKTGFCDPRTSRFGMINSQVFTALSDDEWGVPGPESIRNSDWSHNYTLGHPYDWSRGYIDPANGILTSDRPEQGMGYMFFKGGGGTQSTNWNPFAQSTSGWLLQKALLNPNPYCLRPGMMTQNDPDFDPTTVPKRYLSDSKGATSASPQYYSDADGVVRRAMGAYVRNGTNNNFNLSAANGMDMTQSTTIGLPMARAIDYAPGNIPAKYNYSGGSYPANGIVPDTSQAQNQFQSRPMILHRPFRSVAELGYTFSGTPWRNLDFFTPESGNPGLLDIFCINDTNDVNGLVAGRVNLNTRQAPVLQAILAGAYKDEARATNASPLILSSSEAGVVANALVTRSTLGNANTPGSKAAPLMNVGDLVGKWTASVAVSALPAAAPAYTLNDGSKSYDGFTKDIDTFIYGPSGTNTDFSSNNIQRFHEAPIRALASAGQARVWNLLIDLVAQTGRYPVTASDPAKFLVEGEQHYWVHVAIDRYTGKILDKQVEVVKE